MPATKRFKKLILSLIAVIFLSSGCAQISRRPGIEGAKSRQTQVRKSYLDDFAGEVDKQFRRSDLALNYEDFYHAESIVRKQRFGGEKLYDEEEEDWAREFFGDVFENAGQQFVNSHEELDKLENWFKKALTYEMLVGGKKYVRKAAPSEIVYEDLKDTQQEKEVSRFKIRTGGKARTRCGVRLGFGSPPTPIVYVKADNPSFLDTVIDQMGVEIYPVGKMEFKTRKILSGTSKYEKADEETLRKKVFDGEKGVFWYLESSLMSDLNNRGGVPNTRVSLIRSRRKSREGSRTEFFYGYGGNEHQVGVQYVLSF